MARSPQSLSRILATNPAVAGWEARRRREAALSALIRRHLPRQLAERVRVVDGDGEQLELATDAGAVAAIVRQRTPDLVAALRDESWQFTGIRVRVQVRAGVNPQRKTKTNQPDSETLRPLAEFARGLAPGPLKTALDRLLRRMG